MLPLQTRISYIIRKSRWLLKITQQSRMLCQIKKIYFQVQKQNTVKKVQKYGYEALEKIFQISQKGKLPLWIDWGTLLGYVREGRLILHDDDLDIGTYCMEANVHENFLTEMNKEGFRRVREFRDGELLVAEAFEYKGILIDVDYYFRNGNCISWYMFEASEKTKILQSKNQEKMTGMEIYRYDFSPVDIKKGAFKNGTKCNIPVEAEKRVVEMYGPGWNKPDKSCDWHTIDNYVYEGFRENFAGWRFK